MAEEQIVTHIVANADFSNLIADVNRVTASLSEMQQKLAASNKALDNQIKVINNSFAETLRSTGQYSTHFLTLTSDVEKFGRNLDAGRLKLRDYFRVYQDHQKTSTGLIRDLAKQQTQLQNAILQPLGRNAQGLMQFNVHVPRGLDLIKNKTNLAKLELQIMNKVIQDGAVQLINWGKNTQWAGRQLTVGLTVPLAMFGKAAADAFKTADQELTRLTKVYGDVAGTSAEELGKIRQEVTATARELSSAMGVGFNETIALAADIAATGKTGNELLGSLTETTRLAVLGEVDRAEAMRATLAIQTAFKQNTDELSQSINFLNAVENQTSTSLNDLVEAIPKAGPVVKQLGGDIQDLALYLTAMREGGINASESANALKSGLASLINPTKQTVGVMSDFGIDILGMVNKNAGNTTSLLFDLQAALDNLDPLQKAQAIEQLFGKFQFARISALLNNLGRQGSQTLQVLDLMGESASNLEAVAGRELQAVTESASGRYRRAIEGLKADLAGVGEQFLTISTNLINFVDGIVDFANKLPKPVKQALALVGGITAIAGPLIMLTGVLANFFGYIIKGLAHMRALFKGGEGFRLLTPEILAAERAGSLIEKTFYNDAQAASVLNTALKNLIDSFTVLQSKAAAGQFSVNPAVSTMAGSSIVASSAAGRIVDPNNPFLGRMGSRASAHMNPRDPNNPATLFGLAPSTGPVNLKVGRNPMHYSAGNIPGIRGVTEFNGISSGIYAPEAARWHALMATLGMQTRQEMEGLKDTIAAGGAVSRDIMTTFDDILPLMSNVTDNAAKQTSLIVSEMQAGKLTIAQARERIMALNAQVEAELVRTAQMFAASRGRTIDVTKVPGLDQPVVDLSGKSNMRELFHKGRSARMMEALGRATRTRMYGGPYNIETTRPQGLNQGGQVYTMAQGNIVPGPNINADVVPALLTPGEFVVNREATARNLPLLMSINGSAGSYGNSKANGGRPRPGSEISNPLDLERTHITDDLSGIALLLPKWLNQGVNSRREGLTGIQIAAGIREVIEQSDGFGVNDLLLEATRTLGGSRNSARLRLDDALTNLLNTLEAPPNNTRIIGGKNDPFGFERLALAAYKPALRGIRIDPNMSGRNFNLFSALSQIFSQRAGANLTYQRAFDLGLIDDYDSEKARSSSLGQVITRKDGRRTWARAKTNIGAKAPSWATGTNLKTLLTTERGIDSALKILRRNNGGIIPGYNGGGGVKSFANTDPLHGLLQIGKYIPPKNVRGRRVGASVQYKFPGGTEKTEAFLRGSLEERGRYVTEEYMRGNYDVLKIPGAIEAMRALGKKSTGVFHRGISLKGYSRVGGNMRPLPDWLLADIEKAKASGDFTSLIGKEFIMRRSSWSSNSETARGFGDFQLTANVNNRRVTPASQMFPELDFLSPAGKIKVNESESIFGGKFRITGAGPNGLELETVSGPLGGRRAFGGPVNAGMPYVVGENGPEIFVPKNSGGIIPRYAGGGKVLRYQTGGGPVPELKFAGPELIAAAQKAGLIPTEPQPPSRGRMIGAGVARMGIGTAGWMLGSQLTGGNMMGGMLGGILGDIGGTAAYNGIINYNKAIGEAEKRTNLLTKAISGFRSLPGPVQAVSAVVTLGLVIKGVNDRINEHRRIVDQGFAPTEDTIDKLNLRFEKTVDVLNQVQENMKAMQETGQALYRTTTGIGVPGVSLSIEEFDQLSERVKSDFPDLVEVFNKAKPDEVAAKAEQLKAQFIAGGMGAQDATNFIYTLIKASNDANLALSAIGAEGFKSITDGATAAKSAITTFESLTSNLNIDQIPEAFDTARNAINAMRKGLVGTKDETGNVLTEADALKAAFEAISVTAEGNKNLSIAQLNELRKQSPVFKDILGSAENLASVYAKTELYARGITTNLKQLNAEQAQLSLSIFTAMETEFTSTEGPFKSLAKNIESLQKSSDIEKITKAVQKNQDQIKKEIDLRQKNIQKIKEEADARLQALDRERDDEDALLQIKKLQLQYQNQIASGNLEAAAQTAIDIQQRTGDQQAELARRAIEDKANQRIKEEESGIERLQKELDRSQKRIDQANKKAEENSKSLAESQQLMMDTVGAMQMARDGIDASERTIINSIRKRLEDRGFGDIARQIDPNPNVENPRQADAAAQGRMRSPIENLFENTFGKVIDPTTGALKVTNVNEARNILRGTPSGVIDVKTMGAPGGFAQTYVTETQLTKAGLTSQKGTVFSDSSGKQYRITGPGLQKGTFAVIPKFDKGINMVPEDMLAIIHKNEAVIPANMNPFNPNNNGTMGSSINVGTVIMKFPETPANGQQMFAEFKEAMRVENLKKGGPVRI